MQSIRFILASFGLAPAAGMKNLTTLLPRWPATLPDTKNQKTPLGNKNWRRISRTNAMPQTLRGLKSFMLQNNNDTWKEKLKRLMQA